MPPKFLFGNRISPACSHCIHTMRLIPKSGQVLCEKHGVVSAEYYCGKYLYEPLWRIPPKPRPLMRFTAEDFTINTAQPEEEQLKDEKES